MNIVCLMYCKRTQRSFRTNCVCGVFCVCFFFFFFGGGVQNFYIQATLFLFFAYTLMPQTDTLLVNIHFSIYGFRLGATPSPFSSEKNANRMPFLQFWGLQPPFWAEW